jgi:hypothetical protein
VSEEVWHPKTQASTSDLSFCGLSPVPGPASVLPRFGKAKDIEFGKDKQPERGEKGSSSEVEVREGTSICSSAHPEEEG